MLAEAPELCLSLSAPAGTRRVPRRQRTAGAGLCPGGHSHQTLSKADAACPLHCLSLPLSRSARSQNALGSSRHPPAFASGTFAAAWCAHLRERCGPVTRRLPRCWSVSWRHPARAHSFYPDRVCAAAGARLGGWGRLLLAGRRLIAGWEGPASACSRRRPAVCSPPQCSPPVGLCCPLNAFLMLPFLQI